VIKVAAGVFAPGHLGELTQHVPFEMVDAVLAEAGPRGSRVREVPARVVVYLLLAGALFAEVGYRQVWDKLVAALDGVPVARPSSGVLAQARARLGPAPLRALFDLVRGPGPAPRTRGRWWRGLLVCAIDGTSMAVAASDANQAEYTQHRCNHGGSGYPKLRLLVLVCCGTRTVIDAVFGPTTVGEVPYAKQLVAALRSPMVVLLDRAFGAADLIEAIAQTNAHLVVRVKDNRKLPVIRRLPDGSYLSVIGKLRVRVVECQIHVATTTGRTTTVYRLVTTLTDHCQYPAFDLVRLYHERWEIETAFLELKSTILGGRVLRARTPAGVRQEIYALLVTYQAIRLAMADATDTQPDLDPDRACFTTALSAARDLVVQAANTITDTVIDLAGAIGRRVLANLMPDRRTRLAPRIVKRAISKYNAKGPNINRHTYQATIGIDILVPKSP
jgi:hypothetical protein